MLKSDRRLTLSAVLMALLLLVAACSGSSSSESTSTTESSGGTGEIEGLISPGTFTVGTSGSYAPYTYITDDGELTGYDVELATIVAERLGLTADIQAADFSGLYAGLSAGQYDAVASAVSLEDDESPDYMLSKATLVDGVTLLVLADSDITALEDIDGMRMGGPTGTAALDTMDQELDADWEVVTFPGMTEAVQGLKDDRVDGLAVSRLLGSYMTTQDDELRVLDETVSEFHSGFATSNAGGQELVDAINTIIDELIADGTIADLQEKYFGVVALP